MTSDSSVLTSDGAVKANDTMSAKIGGKVEGDVALGAGGTGVCCEFGSITMVVVRGVVSIIYL